MGTGWLTSILQVFSPAKSLSKCDKLYARMPPAPIAFAVGSKPKKNKKRKEVTR
jgi:hypothetical protein